MNWVRLVASPLVRAVSRRCRGILGRCHGEDTCGQFSLTKEKCIPSTLAPLLPEGQSERIEPNMAVSLITIEKRYGTTTMAIFSVSLADKRQVFMRVDDTPYENEHRGVVIVDARKFLKLWRADPYKNHREIAQGNPHTWRQDRKFKDAAEGFSYGFKNPVPLAWVGYAEVKLLSVSYKFLWFGRKAHTRHVRYISFVNGITRTIWLLSHGCEAFPVECRMPEAIKLHRAASVVGTRVFTVRDVQERLIPVNHPPPYH